MLLVDRIEWSSGSFDRVELFFAKAGVKTVTVVRFSRLGLTHKII